MRKYLLPSALILLLGLGYGIAQNVNKALQLSQSPGAFGVDANNSVYFPRHILSVGRAPTVSDGTVSGTDFQGTITESSNSIGGVLTFNLAYLAAPNCVLSAQSPSSSTPITYTTATTNITYSHLSQVSKKISYICSGSS